MRADTTKNPARTGRGTLPKPSAADAGTISSTSATAAKRSASDDVHRRVDDVRRKAWDVTVPICSPSRQVLRRSGDVYCGNISLYSRCVKYSIQSHPTRCNGRRPTSRSRRGRRLLTRDTGGRAPDRTRSSSYRAASCASARALVGDHARSEPGAHNGRNPRRTRCTVLARIRGSLPRVSFGPRSAVTPLSTRRLAGSSSRGDRI